MISLLPIDQRIKIVNVYEQGFGTLKEIAKIFDITTRSVLRYVKLHRETGGLVITASSWSVANYGKKL